MLVIQDPELMQLMHEQKSLSWHKQLNQTPIFELPFTSYFLLLINASIIALGIGAHYLHSHCTFLLQS